MDIELSRGDLSLFLLIFGGIFLMLELIFEKISWWLCLIEAIPITFIIALLIIGLTRK
jgi:hypothetical protein